MVEGPFIGACSTLSRRRPTAELAAINGQIEPASVSVPARAKGSDMKVDKSVHPPFHSAARSREHMEADRLVATPHFTPKSFCVWTRQRAPKRDRAPPRTLWLQGFARSA
jgi:hypothetical protein